MHDAPIASFINTIDLFIGQDVTARSIHWVGCKSKSHFKWPKYPERYPVFLNLSTQVLQISRALRNAMWKQCLFKNSPRPTFIPQKSGNANQPLWSLIKLITSICYNLSILLSPKEKKKYIPSLQLSSFPGCFHERLFKKKEEEKWKKKETGWVKIGHELPIPSPVN